MLGKKHPRRNNDNNKKIFLTNTRPNLKTIKEEKKIITCFADVLQDQTFP